MSYSLQWCSPALPYAQKQLAISVPAGAVVSNAASIKFTGKGAANYGKLQQENLMQLLENFAGDTAPAYPTVGQLWYHDAERVLKVCTSTAPEPVVWRSLNATQITGVGISPPLNPILGDSWFSKTGNASGIQYVYTGVGRYPQITWTRSTGAENGLPYYPAAMAATPAAGRTVNAILNTTTFSGAVGSDYGEAYIHGYTGNTPADVNGVINWRAAGGYTVPVVLAKGALYTNLPVTEGFLVYDKSGSSLVSTTGTSYYFSVRTLPNNTFQYDNGTEWVTFTPNTASDNAAIAIGNITVYEVDDGSSPGISSITIWEHGVSLAGLEMVPATLPNGAIGGWEQSFPAIDRAAGRREYDYLMGLVLQLGGDQMAFSGNGALSSYLSFLTPFNTLDASLLAALGTAGYDQNVAVTSYSSASLREYLTEVDSQDWDKLLAASRWLISRLDLPGGFIDDISPVPFVQDGRPMDPVIRSPNPYIYNPTNDAIIEWNHPFKFRPERTATTRFGTIAMSRLYQETVNVLEAAIKQRFVLKGMLGTSGTNTSFDSHVTINTWKSFVANAAGTPFSGAGASNGINFYFDPVGFGDIATQFFTSGQAIEIVCDHVPSVTPTAFDTALKTLVNTKGRLRITFDKLFVMNTSPSPALTQAPIDGGFNSMAPSGWTVLGTISNGTASIVVEAWPASIRQIVGIRITVVAGGATTGTFTVTWNWISDNTLTHSGARIFPQLYNSAGGTSYSSSDKVGSSLFT